MSLYIGQVVKIKSGGAPMTVNAFQIKWDDYIRKEVTQALCLWMVRDGTMHSGWFSIESLSPVDIPQKA